MVELFDQKYEYPLGKWGRKDDYWTSPAGMTKIEAWVRNGITLKQLCLNMAVDKRTFRVWLAKYPELAAVFQRSKEVADIEVENALYKRACGFSYTEVQTTTGPEGTTVRTTVKYVPPDPNSAQFWLKNRKAEDWRDKREVSHNFETPPSDPLSAGLEEVVGGLEQERVQELEPDL